MTATLALIRDTFREAIARKIFWGLFGLSSLMILFFLFVMKIDIVAGATASISLFGFQNHHTQDVDRLVRGIFAFVATFLYSFGMFLAVFASSGLTPSVLEPGRIELLLSKPVSRWHILLGRYTGNLLVVVANTVYLVVGVWLILGSKTGIWNPAFLLAIPTTIFIFAVLLAVIVLVGVLWDSTALSIMITVGLMIEPHPRAERHCGEADVLGMVPPALARALLRPAESARSRTNHLERNHGPHVWRLDADLDLGIVWRRRPRLGSLRFFKEELLKRAVALLLPVLFLLTSCRPGLRKAVHIDPALETFIPADSTYLLGVNVEQLRQTPVYRKVTQLALPEVDRFAAETGVDPRKDIQEVLACSNGNGMVTMVRGRFTSGELERKLQDRSAHASGLQGPRFLWKRGRGLYFPRALDSGRGQHAGPQVHHRRRRRPAWHPRSLRPLLDAVPDRDQLWAIRCRCAHAAHGPQ